MTSSDPDHGRTHAPTTLANPHAVMARGTEGRVAPLVPRLSLTNPTSSMERRLPGARRSPHRFVCAMAGRVDPLVPWRVPLSKVVATAGLVDGLVSPRLHTPGGFSR